MQGAGRTIYFCRASTSDRVEPFVLMKGGPPENEQNGYNGAAGAKIRLYINLGIGHDRIR